MYNKNYSGADKVRWLSEYHPDPDVESLCCKKDRIIHRDYYTEIYTEPSFDYVMIKTTEKVMIERGGSLYDSTNRFWYAGKRISDYTYVVSVVDQVVQRVYIADEWFKFSDGVYAGRWGFFGREAHGAEFDAIIGKRIPENYRARGNASPVLYKVK